MWGVWVLSGLIAWLLVAGTVAVVVGKGIRLADRRSLLTSADRRLTTADLPAAA